MSTYNGGKYIREQIDSILNQKGVHVRLIVRDDGSKDETLSILEEYKSNDKLLYYTGKNLGPQYSFMHLLQNAEADDYYAFADQDDVWLEDKLYVAVSMLENHNEGPALYFSQTQLVDSDLNKIDNVVISPFLTLGESLIYACASGCTMVFNNKLKNIVTGKKLPPKMPMHDIWLVLTNMAVGGYTHFDTVPHILYRQHGDNEVGLGHGFMYMLKLRMSNFLSRGNVRYTQALNVYNTYKEEIPQANKALLFKFIEGKKSFVKRISIIFDKKYRCSDKTTQFLFWINVLFNKY